MTAWKHTLHVEDVFRDPERTLPERATVIADRIAALRLGPASPDARAIAASLREVETTEQFDEVWDEFYDFADWERIWVVTR